MKIATLILAAALPIIASAQGAPSVREQAQMASKAIASIPFRSHTCRFEMQRLAQRARGAGDAQALALIDTGLPFAEHGAQCKSTTEGLMIATQWEPADGMRCRYELWINTDGSMRGVLDNCE